MLRRVDLPAATGAVAVLPKSLAQFDGQVQFIEVHQNGRLKASAALPLGLELVLAGCGQAVGLQAVRTDLIPRATI